MNQRAYEYMLAFAEEMEKNLAALRRLLAKYENGKTKTTLAS